VRRDSKTHHGKKETLYAVIDPETNIVTCTIWNREGTPLPKVEHTFVEVDEETAELGDSYNPESRKFKKKHDGATGEPAV
jgi:hypothetical protein